MEISSNENSDGFSRIKSKKPITRKTIKHSTKRKRLEWLPAVPSLVPEPEFCPEAITEYTSKLDKSSSSLALKARKHLSYLGWKIEFVRDNDKPRLRYISHDGKCYLSLRQLCLDLRDTGSVLISQDDHSSYVPSCGGWVSSPLLSTKKPLSCKEEPVPPKANVVSHLNGVVVEPEYCPQAVEEYYLAGSEDKNGGRVLNRDVKIGGVSMILKAKKHLSAIGWSFHYVKKRGGRELRYCCPDGRVFYSLRTACKFCIDEGGHSSSDTKVHNSERRENINVSKEAMNQLAVEGSSTPGMESQGSLVAAERSLTPGVGMQGSLVAVEGSSPPRMEIEGSSVSEDAIPEKQATDSSCKRLSMELGIVKGIKKPKKRIKIGVLKSAFPFKQTITNGDSTLERKGKESKASIKQRNNMDGDFSAFVVPREVAVPSSSHHHTPRTVLSCLIDNNVVLPWAKVCYRGRKDGLPMAKGQITRDGINCSCCQKVFTLSKFEAHAGSTNHRPSANIFLEDGRSLQQCQLQLKLDNNQRSVMREPPEMKGTWHDSSNDYICSVCHEGGELILCDQCPSAFHTSCLGLKDVPDGDWFCPPCCCGICGKGRFNKDSERFTFNTVLSCDQCGHQYHIGCLRKKGIVKVYWSKKKNWFCTQKCEQVFLGLHRLLGKPVPVGEDNLTWTLMKYVESGGCGHGASDIEASMENYSKLNFALGVMHECFEPVKEPRTRRDLVEDVIFSRESELNRLNFRGFYTVVLERNDELITVATVRVFGEKVAEVPLVATRFKYRRLGMCQILMNELEKQLKELGVERLTLPAIPGVLNTWTSSFGFSRMTESQRLRLLDYTLLNFQGTTMCQKLLLENPSKRIRPSKRNQEQSS
ncbi:unnamed protein product [Ilex paraguariensis]|uniref:PHD finger transcription factor n=1 Tax=Ilex paraguariensis TaxID=185542 RepID=A0ABC8S4J3_9AQUA